MTIVALAYLAFGLVSWFVLALVLQIIIGFAIVTVYTTTNTLVQQVIPPSLRGRMTSLGSFVLVGSMPIGAALGSIGVSTIGARLTTITGALFFAVISLFLIASTKGKFQRKLTELV